MKILRNILFAIAFTCVVYPTEQFFYNKLKKQLAIDELEKQRDSAFIAITHKCIDNSNEFIRYERLYYKQPANDTGIANMFRYGDSCDKLNKIESQYLVQIDSLLILK